MIFEKTSCKADIISVLTRCCPLAICQQYAEPFSKTCSNCSIIQSVWLYNILVLVHNLKRNTSMQKRVKFLKVKVTMTKKNGALIARAVSLNLCND